MDSRRLSIALLITAVVLNVQTNGIEEGTSTNVPVEVSVDYEHVHNNRSELTCEAPEKPLNGGYASETRVGGGRYNTGDTIQYYCYSGHQLIGQVNRTCNGSSEEWEPKQPYCEPQFVDRIMRRLDDLENQLRWLNGIEDQMRAIEQRITTMDKNTIQIGYNISVMDSIVLTINKKVAAADNMVSVTNDSTSVNNYNVSETVKKFVDTDRLLVCTGNTTAADEDTASKCSTMQMGVRNGRSVSVHTWVIQDHMNKVANELGDHYSQPFYHTVPGYKFRLTANIYSDGEIFVSLQLLQGEYDDELKWPVSQEYNVTLLTNDGLEALATSFSVDHSTCHSNRPKSDTGYRCLYEYWPAKKHILNDGSVVVRLYFYN